MPHTVPDVIASKEEALMLLTESALSTVAHIVWRKDGSRAERVRRIGVAQAGIDAIVAAGLDTSALDVCVKTSEVCRANHASVRVWAQGISPGANLQPFKGASVMPPLPIDDAIIFITDALLATLEEIVPRRSTSRAETTRIAAMASIGVDFLRSAGIVVHGRSWGSRICEISDLYCGRVDIWMEQFRTQVPLTG